MHNRARGSDGAYRAYRAYGVYRLVVWAALVAVRRPAAPRPAVVSRSVWGADDSLRTEPVTYTGAARAVFIHHTGHPDDYDCDDAPAMLRAMHADHVLRMGWDDLGYNFV